MSGESKLGETKSNHSDNVRLVNLVLVVLVEVPGIYEISVRLLDQFSFAE
jgi:hypothetical protein